MTPFDAKLDATAKRTEALLDELLSGDTRPDETIRPERLIKAMHYGALNGGKRLRPFLVVESARLFGGDEHAALRVGAALECLHSYSLVHDDLPAMDDDDLRRGKPTVHIAFDEATAILAGDALLTYAFDIIAAPETALPDGAKLAIVLALATIGVVALYSVAGGSGSPWAVAHAIRFSVFMVMALVMSYIPSDRLKPLLMPAYGFCMLLLLVVLAIGTFGGGAKSWINLGFMQFQPSELLKRVLLALLARV